ncbi:MAG: hypothetical protein LQ338_005557 [Usnochroma carphineum]|nr:MAG: hypothetical protein LQ338_005557 [Usnochroma carphineum]
MAGSLDTMQWNLFLYLFLLITCCTHQSLADDEPRRERDSRTSGNYIINNCQRVHHFPQLDQLLNQSRQALELVLSDLELGTGSPHGFRTFFKSNTNLPIAKQVFRAIAGGQNLTTGKPPAIECVSPEGLTGQILATYRKLCTPAGREPSHAASLPLRGTIVLCPTFWEAPDFPGVDDCVGVSGRRGKRLYVDNGWTLRDTKFAILVHELVHLYNPSDGAAKTAEVYDIRDCAELDKDQSVGNAENWAIYAACEFDPVFFLPFSALCSPSSPLLKKPKAAIGSFDP